jgi:hypothetical protein
MANRIAPKFMLLSIRPGLPFGLVISKNHFMPPAFSEEMALMQLRAVEEDLIEGEYDLLSRQIKDIGLAVELTEHDQRVLISLATDVDLMEAVLHGHRDVMDDYCGHDEIGLELIAAYMMIAVIANPNQEAQIVWGMTGGEPDVDIRMPRICESGCHPVVLLINGDEVTEGNISTAREARQLIGRWAYRFYLSKPVMIRLRTKAVRRTAQYNRKLDRRRERAARQRQRRLNA